VGTIEAGGKCTLTTVFKPTISGFIPAPLTITSNDPLSPKILYYAGPRYPDSCACRSYSAQRHLGFDNHAERNRSEQRRTAITFGGISTSCWNATVGICTYYSQTNNCGSSLAGGQSCTVVVSFTPQTTGTIAGTLLLSDSDPGTSPQPVTLSGNAVAAPKNTVARNP